MEKIDLFRFQINPERVGLVLPIHVARRCGVAIEPMLGSPVIFTHDANLFYPVVFYAFHVIKSFLSLYLKGPNPKNGFKIRIERTSARLYRRNGVCGKPVAWHINCCLLQIEKLDWLKKIIIA